MKRRAGAMRFFHIADVHLGASPDAGFPWSEERKNEIWDSFCNVIYAVREEKPLHSELHPGGSAA